MEKQIDWSKAPEWANAVIESRDCQEFYVSQWGGISARQRIGYSEVDSDSSADMTLPHDWTLVATRQAPWNGEGLPPVGVVCLVHDDAPHHHYAKHVGQSVEILAHTTSAEGGSVAVYKVDIRDSSEYHGLIASCFKPIKTAEQIALEERQQAIDAMLDEFPGLAAQDAVRIFKAGYRKQ